MRAHKAAVDKVEWKISKRPYYVGHGMPDNIRGEHRPMPHGAKLAHAGWEFNLVRNARAVTLCLLPISLKREG